MLIAFLYLSSLLQRWLYLQTVNNTILNEILASSSLSKAVCILVYCIITPLLEEIVYRRFLLASLSSTMKWQYAVLISSGIFSAAHLSGENFLQLFMIGCVLGCSYSWTGDLRSSIVTHSMYNALILAITLLSLSWVLTIGLFAATISWFWDGVLLKPRIFIKFWLHFLQSTKQRHHYYLFS